MKVLIFLISILFCINHYLFGQSTKYPKGVYLTYDEILTKSPSLSIELVVRKRTKGDIKLNGGNDYKPFKRSISEETIEEDYFAYSDGDTLYMNGRNYRIQPWYTPVLSDGKFFVLIGGLSSVPQIQSKQLKSKVQIGFMFGALGGGIQGASNAMLRFIYIINKETNEISYVSSDYFMELLGSNPELLETFNQESQTPNQEIILKYLDILNKE